MACPGLKRILLKPELNMNYYSNDHNNYFKTTEHLAILR